MSCDQTWGRSEAREAKLREARIFGRFASLRTWSKYPKLRFALLLILFCASCFASDFREAGWFFRYTKYMYVYSYILEKCILLREASRSGYCSLRILREAGWFFRHIRYLLYCGKMHPASRSFAKRIFFASLRFGHVLKIRSFASLRFGLSFLLHASLRSSFFASAPGLPTVHKLLKTTHLRKWVYCRK